MRYSIIGATAQQVIELGGTEIKETHKTGIVFATMSLTAARRLEDLGFVVCEVKKVSTTYATPTVSPPTPIEAEPIYTPSDLATAAGFDQLRLITDPPLFGKAINVAVIDTGIRETHADIMSRVVYRKNYTLDIMQDGFDHGTGVTSIILAVAPLCGILNMKVLNNNGEGTEEEVVTAIDDCMDLLDTDPVVAPSVINLSLGSVDDGNPNNVVRVACRAAVEQGIWILAAAGNGGPDAQTITTPASERLVLAVGSLSLDPFTISSFSSRGPTMEGLTKPDAVAFGENIFMASSSGDTSKVAKSGTSFSTPLNSGLVAIYHEGVLRLGGSVKYIEVPPGIYPELKNLVTIEQLLTTYLQGLSVKPEGSPVAKDNDYGFGMPFGSLIVKQFTPVAGVGLDITSIMSAMVGVMMVGMMAKGLNGNGGFGG